MSTTTTHHDTIMRIALSPGSCSRVIFNPTFSHETTETSGIGNRKAK